MSRKCDIRSESTKKLLRDTMVQLLNQEDFDHITVDRICTNANVSRSTFYLYYQDKYDLFVNCIYEMVEPKGGQLMHESLECYFDRVLDVIYKNRKLMSRLQKYNGSREIQRKIDAKFIDIFSHYYCALQQQGIQLAAPIELIAEYVCGGVLAVINYWIKNNLTVSKETLIKLMVSFVREASKA